MASNDEYPTKRKRSSSPNPRGGDLDTESEDSEASPTKSKRKFDLSVDVCRDFTRNFCRRSEIDCKFAHPHSSVAINRDKVTACADSLRNRCFRGRTCRYYHPPPHIQVLLREAAGMGDARVDMVCRDFMRGRCIRPANECRYSHHSPTDVEGRAIVCQDFVHGNCRRKSCRYSHVREAPESARVGVLQSGRVGPALAFDSEDLNFTFVQREAPLICPTSQLQHGSDKGLLPVCMDFLRKKCSRSSCKFVHPNPHTKVVRDKVEICRDFLQGACQRKDCRFYHPLTRTGISIES